MAAAYLNWLTEVFEEAQVPFTAETADYLDKAVRKIAGAENADEETVYRKLRQRWLNHGQPGRQLLAGFIRDEVFARRDSPFRPVEGGGYYTADYKVTAQLPPVPHREEPA
jgi:hypothetical protein